MLTSALHSNYTTYYKDIPAKMAAQDYEPQCCAVDLEYDIFKISKAANLYKAAVLSKCGEIKKTTSEKELHKTLVPKWSEDNMSSPQDETSRDKTFCDKATNSGFSCAFVKASDMVKEEETADNKGDNLSHSGNKRDNPCISGKNRVSLYSKINPELESKLLEEPEEKPVERPSASLELEVASILDKYKPSTSSETELSSKLTKPAKSSQRTVKSERVRFSDDILFKKQKVSTDVNDCKENFKEKPNVSVGQKDHNDSINRLSSTAKSHDRKVDNGVCDKDVSHDKHVTSSSSDKVKDRKIHKRPASSSVRQDHLVFMPPLIRLWRH